MKRILILGLLAAFALPTYAQQNWQLTGQIEEIDVTSTASTGEKIEPLGTQSCNQYKVENLGSTDFTLGFGTTAAEAETNAADVPASGDPGWGVLVRAGEKTVMQANSRAFVSAKTASGTSTLRIGCGTGQVGGLVGSVTLAGGTAPTPPTGASATQVQGTAAHDDPVAGNPVLIGAYASSTPPTNVTNGDAARLWSGTVGQLIIGTGLTTGSDNKSNAELTAPYGPDGTAGVMPNYVFDGTNWDRMRGNITGVSLTNGAATMVDGETNGPTILNTFDGGRVIGQSYPFVFNGSTWDRQRGTSTGGTLVQCAMSTLNGSTSQQVKASAGQLCGVFIASGSACTLKFWNNTAGSGTVLVNTFTPSVPNWYALPFPFSTGLFVTVGGTCDYSIGYN